MFLCTIIVIKIDGREDLESFDLRIYNVLFEAFDLDKFAEEGHLGTIAMLYDEFSLFHCKYDYNTSGLQTLLNYPEDFRFHLIIVDATLGRCFYPLIERFHNPPAVAVTPFLLPPPLSKVFGSHLHTSYVPHYNTEYSNRMSIFQRIINFVYTYTEVLYRDYVFLPKEDALIRKRFGALTSSVDELERNVSLLLCNTDPIMGYPMPLPPNIITVGGLHIKPAQALPRDLQKIYEEAKHGVILFSFGTYVRADKLSLDVKQAFLKAFAKLPQTVIWKYESDDLGELPKNVFVRKWLPQNDMLGHPNTKLFISHGGAHSTQETIYHGVPVIGVPFFVDQYVNIRRMEDNRIAKHLGKIELTEENIFKTIQEILNDSMYRDNMLIWSKRYRDQPQTALERGIFWVEYVLRHGGAEHLVPSARDMPSYQTENLDLLAVWVLGVILIYSVLLFALTLCRFTFSLRKSDFKLS